MRTEGNHKIVYRLHSRIFNVLKWSRYENRFEKKDNKYFLALFIYSVYHRVSEILQVITR
jgi:hypothetical protein